MSSFNPNPAQQHPAQQHPAPPLIPH